jgi:hypothetical protein
LIHLFIPLTILRIVLKGEPHLYEFC